MNIAIFLYNQFVAAGMTREAACAMLAQIQAESGFNPKNLEDSANSKLGMSDEMYTALVDNGEYQNFVNDGAGYGLPQITYYKRKEWFLSFAQKYETSIGDARMQTAYILWELQNHYQSIWKQLCTSHDLYGLTHLLLYQWENPAEKENNMRKRYEYAQKFFAIAKDTDHLPDPSETTEAPVVNDSSSPVEKYVQFAIAIANDNSYGYSQANRWGPDFDCSSMTIACVQAAGIPVKDRGATYTGNMRKVFTACGFKDVTASCNLSNGAGMQRGDILLNDVDHVAIYIGNGQLVHARSSEGNSIQGDQSGNEIRVQGYYNYPWNIILRYGGGNNVIAQGSVESVAADMADSAPLLRKGSKGGNVVLLQKKLIELGYDVGPDGADGDFGDNTAAALMRFQRDYGLEVDGVFGNATFLAMQGVNPQSKPSSENKVPVQNNTAAAVQDKQEAVSGDKNGMTKGAVVMFKGNKCYSSNSGGKARTVKPGKARITKVKAGEHPYFLAWILFGGSNVLGWCDAGDIEVI